ncbi:uncharacterized protein LOC125532282 isoform X2 [Triticum urartu]|uniref:uncharacterized protein LOC125532282 isoform X2 n=1 Tax=Triticum urartu TaxID=4572 RepID=UPI0020440937|nr:uncharacterized protein LOC125532282 isoform X2 [Triticum urartu]
MGGAAGGERRITIREGACHRGVQAAALLRNGVWLRGRGRGQRQEEGAGRRGLQAAGLFLAHTVSFDWKSETEDRAYCFGSEWPEILWLDVPRAIGPFQDRVELRYISFIEARVIPVDFAWRTRLFLLKLGVRLLCGKAKTHSGNMSPTSPRSRIVYSGYSVPQALQNNAQSNFSSGHDSLKLLSSILKKRLTQINGHAPCT